jgi:photosystem II stability/assembly factor-like uncharacterized protein
MPFSRTTRALVTTAAVCCGLVQPVSAQVPTGRILQGFEWRSVGPANTGGRVSDVEAVAGDPKVIFVGFASSGLWRSTNNGITWAPMFDYQPVASIGDLAIFQDDPNILYAGTGEPNNRNSSPWGGGVFKSTDGGNRWEYVGLKETHHIGRVLIDPADPDTVYVAALGHLWGPNPERGLYKTTDGGGTWQQVLAVDDRTGVIDVAMDPVDHKILYAATYERERGATTVDNPHKRWGPGSGVHVSKDGGATWTRARNGLPTVELGRIGLATARSAPGTVYAVIEAPSPGTLFGFGNREPNTEDMDPNHGGFFRSTDYGESWTQVNEFIERPFYFSEIDVDPTNADVLWYSGLRLHYSTDGGASFQDRTGSQHGDFHGVWINPADPDHVIAAQDGGVAITYDRGVNWDLNLQMATVEFYQVTADMRKPYFVYGGLQDNGSWGGPSRTRSQLGIRNRDWFNFLGGDGFYVQVDPNEPNIVFSDHEYGRLWRIDMDDGERRFIQPHPINTINFADRYPDFPIPARPGVFAPRSGLPTPFRYEWNAPLAMSTHNSRTLYFGNQHLMKSVDRGESWSIISPNLTGRPSPGPAGGSFGGDSHTALLSIAEAPHNPSVLWAGTNDGRLWLTRDGGVNWTELTDSLDIPENYLVKRIEASSHSEERAYVVLDGHTNDDMAPHVYGTSDSGLTWRDISANLPEGSVYVIREDRHNPELLFVGTEFGAWASLDRGSSWVPFNNGLPTVAVHDLYIHPRDGDLIAGTHGRGMWIVDNITALQQLDREVQSREAFLFRVRPEVQWAASVESRRISDKAFRAPNPLPGSKIYYYISRMPDRAILENSDVSGQRRAGVRLGRDQLTAGLHEYRWNHRFPEEPDGAADHSPVLAEPGEYLVTFTIDDQAMTTVLLIERDTPTKLGK